MKSKFTKQRSWLAGLVMVGTVAPGAAYALEFDVFDVPVQINNLATMGTVLRLQNRDPSLIGKSNLNPGLCVARVPGTPDSNPSFSGDTCNSTTNAQPNLDFVNAPGAFSLNGDDGNLSFDKGDVVHAAIKMTSDINFQLGEYNFFARSLVFYDPLYDNHDVKHPDTTAQPASTDFSDKGREGLAFDFKFLDFFVSRPFEAFDRDFSIKIGNQVINWGESAFLLLNSLNVINPPDQSRLRIPWCRSTASSPMMSASRCSISTAGSQSLPTRWAASSPYPISWVLAATTACSVLPRRRRIPTSFTVRRAIPTMPCS